MTSLYTMMPLEKARKEIRLIALSPGAFDDDIKCSLTVASLLETPKYEALSYVWGDATKTESILLNNQERQVTTNLAVALRYLREGTRGTKEPRILWIDALSIDQSSDEEKAWQVAMMSSIYASCEKANVWLGPELDSNDLKHAGWFSMSRMYPGIDIMMQMTLGLVLELAQDNHLDDLNALDYREGEWDPCDDDPSLALQGVKVLLHRPWWERVWVVQEVAIPSKTAVTVGYLELEWKDFTDAAQNFPKHASTCCEAVHSKIKGYNNGYFESFHNAINPIAVLQSKQRMPGHSSSFMELFYGFCNRRATLGQDKIFSLYGLLEQDDPVVQNVPVNYSVSAEDLCRQVTVALLKTGSLDVLTGDQFLKQLPNRPSWEKDFTMTLSSNQKYKEAERFIHQKLFQPYHEPGTPITASPEVIQVGVLRVRGVHMDTVKAIVGKPYPEGLILDTDNIYPWLLALEEVEKMSREDVEGTFQIKVNEQQNLKEAFWRTMLGEHIAREESANDLANKSQSHATPFGNRQRLEGENLRQIADWIPKMWKKPKHANLNSFEEAMLTTVLGRSFVIGGHGYFGLVPKEAQVGDEIWVLHGGRLPFLLRKSANESEEKMRIIGDCFIHEIMDGRMTKEAAKVWKDVLLC